MSIIDRGPDKHGRQRFEVRVSCGYKNGKQVRVVKTFFCKTKNHARFGHGFCFSAFISP